MRIKMVEIEYAREGETESWGVLGGEVTGEPVKYDGKFSAHRKRIAPHTLSKTVKYLSKRCWTGVSSEDGATPTKLLLPPAKIIRKRSVTIEFGEWEQA